MLVSDLFRLISQLVSSATNLAKAALLWTSKEWEVVAHMHTSLVYSGPFSMFLFHFAFYGYVGVKQTN